jgi:hypothetical protein
MSTGLKSRDTRVDALKTGDNSEATGFSGNRGRPREALVPHRPHRATITTGLGTITADIKPTIPVRL